MTSTILDPAMEPYAALIQAAERGELSSPQQDEEDPDPFMPGDMNVDVLAAVIERYPRALWAYAQICKVETHPYDAEAGAQFLRRLFPDDTPGLIEFRTKDSDNHARRFWLRPEDIGEEAEWVHRMNRRGWPVWVGIAPRKNSKDGGAENCLPCRWLWADIDFKSYGGGELEARSRLADFKPEPTMVVESGGGLHPYWRVEYETGINWLTVFKAKLQAIAQKIGADSCAAEPARVLRLPGTANHKYEPPVKVQMVDYALL